MAVGFETEPTILGLGLGALPRKPEQHSPQVSIWGGGSQPGQSHTPVVEPFAGSGLPCGVKVMKGLALCTCRSGGGGRRP